MNPQARLYRVRGRVQGVGFRYYVERVARELGLAGYAKNLADGSVEVYAVGPEPKLGELAGRLWTGPLYSQVRAVEEEAAAVRRIESFRVEPSW